jgi:uncharacterized protein DUF5317
MLVSGAVIGLIAGLALHGNLRPLEKLHLRAIPFLIPAILARLVAPAIPSFGLGLEILAIFAIGLIALVNWRTDGMALIAMGSGFNLLVILANQGMPVTSEALLAAGAEMPRDPLHIVATDSTRVAILGDIIPIAVFRSVYSVGDFVIALGGFLVPFRALLKS